MAATPDVALATPDVAPCLTAPGGELIQAGACPLPAHTSPAATGAGGLTGGGGGGLHIGLLEPIAVPRDDDFERVQRARDLMLVLKPLIDLPERARGRREMAQQIGRDLKLSVAQVYRLAERAREGGVMALARMGQRRDRGQARTLIGERWVAWADAVVQHWPQAVDVARLAERMRQAVRQAWVAGAPSERQCWLKATAAVARDLMTEGCPREWAAGLLSIPAPRRYLAAEGQYFRVAGRARRDAKGIYDRHLAPVKRTAAGLMPGDLVCGDITPLDIPVLREDGSTAYARLIAWHDIATNWLWGDLVLLDAGEGIRREHVAASFARMCEEAPFGAPKRLYLDNGSEYKWDEMLLAAKRLADLTGAQFAVDEASTAPEDRRVIRSIPFRPRAKRIEGVFGNLTGWLGWWLGYVGGNRMTKKVVTLGKGVQPARFEEVREWLGRTLADYHATPQPGAEHMGGMSPQQRLEQALATNWAPWRIDRLLLALAFADYHERRVVRGTVSVGGETYFADFLMAIEGRVTVAVPRIVSDRLGGVAYILDGQRILGMAERERVYGITDPAGAREANRRAKALATLTGELAASAGGPLDEQRLAGTLAELHGLDETLARAEAAKQTVEPTPEVAALMEGMRAHYRKKIEQINERRQIRLDAEKLNRYGVEDDEETRLAREMGL